MPPPKNLSPKVRLPPRLPPLPRLKVGESNKAERNPCTGVMTAVLGCWASYGNASANCVELETALRTCMDTPRPDSGSKPNINFHLSRMQERYTGPIKPAKPTKKRK